LSLYGQLDITVISKLSKKKNEHAILVTKNSIV
jgi:hypothetical protein